MCGDAELGVGVAAAVYALSRHYLNNDRLHLLLRFWVAVLMPFRDADVAVVFGSDTGFESFPHLRHPLLPISSYCHLLCPRHETLRLQDLRLRNHRHRQKLLVSGHNCCLYYP